MSIATKEGLSPRDIPGTHDQDALDQLREVTSRGPSHHQVLQIFPDPPEGPTRPSVIRIPRLGEAGVGCPYYLIRGRIPSPYTTITSGSPCVTPSLLKRKLPVPSPALIITLSQWGYQLNMNRAPLGHYKCTAHIIAVWFYSLKKLHVSISSNPHSSSWAFFCH